MRLDPGPFKRAFVLLSGGVDSTTCLYKAKEHMDSVGGKVVAISMDYGQRHLKELDCAKRICKELNIEHEILDIKGFATGMLTDTSQEVPDCSYDDIDGISPTYIPFRNGFMLSRLAAKAQEYVNKCLAENSGGSKPELREFDTKDLVWIYFGAHAEDAENWAYPDCTPEFIGAMANAIYIGTYRTVRLVTPFSYSSKADIVRTGHRLGVLYEKTWSCYKGEKLHCGTCPTCRARRQAFTDAGVYDATIYQNPVDEKLRGELMT